MNKITVIFTDAINTWEMELTKEEIEIISEFKPILDGNSGEKSYRIVDLRFNLDSGNFTFFIDEEPA